MNKFACKLFAISIMAFSTNAYGQDLVFEPVNPSFGGNPFNSAHLLAIANAQNDYERPQEEASSQDDLDRFIRSLQSRLLSSLSTQVSNAIFGEDAQDSGTIIFGDQRIDFVRTLEGVQLTITEADGSTTVITVPTLITEDPDDDGSSSSQKLVATDVYQTPLTATDNIAAKNDVLAIKTQQPGAIAGIGQVSNDQPIH